jgi:hypothetical protein
MSILSHVFKSLLLKLNDEISKNKKGIKNNFLSIYKKSYMNM